jgi:hypothetical protein
MDFLPRSWLTANPDLPIAAVVSEASIPAAMRPPDGKLTRAAFWRRQHGGGRLGVLTAQTAAPTVPLF